MQPVTCKCDWIKKNLRNPIAAAHTYATTEAQDAFSLMHKSLALSCIKLHYVDSSPFCGFGGNGRRRPQLDRMQTSQPPTRPVSPTGSSFEPANRWVIEDGREYVAIDSLETFDPFFLNLVSPGEQWLFCSSDGSLSAGRRSPDTALFPYYTVDKIINNWNCTGSWTAILVDGELWSPFRPSIAQLSPVQRRLLKSPLGDELVFDETNTALGLRMSYSWSLSDKFGFVRKAKLLNTSSSARRLRLVDGLQDFLPSGIDSRLQLDYSCLADAYKISELSAGGSLLVHRLAAGIIDAPIPLESLLATTVWSHGLGAGPTYLTRRDAEQFLRGDEPAQSDEIRARRGGFFLAREIELAPGESLGWTTVAEIGQTQSQVGELARWLSDSRDPVAEVDADIEDGRMRIRELVAAADGFQETADRDTSLYHYQNTLCNILRGGIPEDGYLLKRDPFLAYIRTHNRELIDTYAEPFDQLPETIARDDLLARVASIGSPDLARLTDEYLPLILSRRHGDPSRPWNRFDIRLKDERGDAIHHFEGNWRDIFQNWEALAWSYPEFLDAFISKFLNASTADGYNPFRITSEGIDWEVPDESNPWVAIGYWGDHQIAYLLKLLELQAKVHPERLAGRLDSQQYVFADVPYRLKSWSETLDDPRDTTIFDRERHAQLLERKSALGADALLLRDAEGSLVRVTLAEKLLLPAVIKLANLVPGGGVWLNTQKPEWNDANNALAGCGLSIVTAGYLHRYLKFLKRLIARHPGEELTLTRALAELIRSLGTSFGDQRWCQQSTMDASVRFELTELAGRAAESHRARIYDTGPGLPEPFPLAEIDQFLEDSIRALGDLLAANRRQDGLWHAYNILAIDPAARTMEIERLPLMLEGQVSILSSGLLEAQDANALLQNLAASDLFSARHRTYLLYPDRELPTFLESNQIMPEQVKSIPSLAGMASCGDAQIIVEDPSCGFRFHHSLTNVYALRKALDQAGIHDDRDSIEALYESVFNHRSFTGRSGTMFGYEGLGSVYWHMVSKLMLAAQEVALGALDAGADPEEFEGLAAHYFAIQGGLGFRKPAEDYGAFPADPYSHSPAHAGAQQPGLTGQVKEGILCRFGELGVDFRDGQLEFRPRLIRRAEFAGLTRGPEHEGLPPDSIRFTISRTPVVYHLDAEIGEPHATTFLSDGRELAFAGASLDRETSSEITRQTGKVTRIEVAIPTSWPIA